MDAIQLIAAERKRQDGVQSATPIGMTYVLSMVKNHAGKDDHPVDRFVRYGATLALEIDRLRRAQGVNESSDNLSQIDYRACWMTLFAQIKGQLALVNPADGKAALEAVVQAMQRIEFPPKEGEEGFRL
jgi:hypothetical protein